MVVSQLLFIGHISVISYSLFFFFYSSSSLEHKHVTECCWCLHVSVQERKKEKKTHTPGLDFPFSL